jgi:hypothetical protein
VLRASSVAAGVAVALLVSGCSSGELKPAARPSSSQASGQASGQSGGASSSPTVPVPAGARLTRPGSGLRFGAPATVVFETTGDRGTVLQLSVRSVRRGALADFKGFLLNDSYKRKAAYFYATVTVKNLGRGDVGGVPVPVWGVNQANTLLPAVRFTTRFPPCPSKNLPSPFGTGASLTTCLVYLSPDRGRLTSLSYRPNQLFNPITWTGTIAPAPEKAHKKAHKKADKKTHKSKHHKAATKQHRKKHRKQR